MKDIYKVKSVEELNSFGVYGIKCDANNTTYIGSTHIERKDRKNYRGFNIRWCMHLRRLTTNRHQNPYLQNAWNKYGEKSFSFIVLEVTDKETVREREQYWIDKYIQLGLPLFNMMKRVMEHKYFMSDEAKLKLSSLYKNKKRDRTIFSHLNKSVDCCTLSGEFIKSYESATLAAEHLGIHRQNIMHCCRGRAKSTGGFTWKYTDGETHEYKIRVRTPKNQ